MFRTHHSKHYIILDLQEIENGAEKKLNPFTLKDLLNILFCSFMKRFSQSSSFEIQRNFRPYF